MSRLFQAKDGFLYHSRSGQATGPFGILQPLSGPKVSGTAMKLARLWQIKRRSLEKRAAQQGAGYAVCFRENNLGLFAPAGEKSALLAELAVVVASFRPVARHDDSHSLRSSDCASRTSPAPYVPCPAAFAGTLPLRARSCERWAVCPAIPQCAARRFPESGARWAG